MSLGVFALWGLDPRPSCRVLSLTLHFFFFFEVFLLSHNVAQVGLEFVILLPQPFSAGITGMWHYVLFIVS